MKRAGLQEVWEGLCGIRDNPKMMEIVTVYVEALIAAQEGRLSPEQLEKLNEINEMVRQAHKEHFGE